MKIFKKAGLPQQSRLEKRVSSFGTSDLVVWVETMLPSIGKAVVHHSRDGVEVLVDAEKEAEAVLAVIRELKKRQSNGF
jgi:hypothetical protein